MGADRLHWAILTEEGHEHLLRYILWHITNKQFSHFAPLIPGRSLVVLPAGPLHCHPFRACHRPASRKGLHGPHRLLVFRKPHEGGTEADAGVNIAHDGGVDDFTERVEQLSKLFFVQFKRQMPHK
ncbi:RNA recognition motif, putative [Leishmania tarentolae]|uniref:RNA recognition motif, putative n=1 Tax=Leishmania tarentolae TaxID=5689 RepID=A0A640KMY8_LEITA|nr:RNA recognition motif, putative [Leishmania tarentolae]